MTADRTERSFEAACRGGMADAGVTKLEDSNTG